jgi:DNA-binding response OmpR family regulator
MDAAPDRHCLAHIDSCWKDKPMAILTAAGPTASRKAEPHTGVLIVDGNASTTTDLERAIRGRNFAAFVAGNGLEAIDIYRRSHDEIGIVLIDVALPGLDGVQTLSALRIINSGIRACFISDGKFEVEYLLDCGAEHVFAKPIQLAEVCDYLMPA